MNVFTYLHHLRDLIGTRYIGTLDNGWRVYSDRRVSSVTPTRIEFEGGGSVSANGAYAGGGKGKIVVLGKGYYSSMTIR